MSLRVGSGRSAFGPIAIQSSAGDEPYPLADAVPTGAAALILDGEWASRFWTTSAAVTLCATSGSDPVGEVENLLDSPPVAEQATSAARPIYYVVGDIKAFRGGYIGGQELLLPFTPLESLEEFTVYLVYQHLTAEPGAIQFAVPARFDADNYLTINQATGKVEYAGAVLGNAADKDTGFGVIELIKTGTGADELATFVNTTVSFTGGESGTETSTTTTPADSNTSLAGWSGLQTPGVQLYFALVFDKAVDADQKAAIRAYIESTFGGLS